MLRYGEAVLIKSQDELNQFCKLFDGLADDALHIDEDYVAYLDNLDGISIVPLSEFVPDGVHEIHTTPFKKWFKRKRR